MPQFLASDGAENLWFLITIAVYMNVEASLLIKTGLFYRYSFRILFIRIYIFWCNFYGWMPQFLARDGAENLWFFKTIAVYMKVEASSLIKPCLFTDIAIELYL